MSPEKNLARKIKELKDKAKIESCADLSKIVEAIEFGKNAHSGQYRKKGDLFFIHPVRVATKALDYKLGTVPVVASLLHDVIEDTKYSSLDIKKQFGNTVAAMVEALTKVNAKFYWRQISFCYRAN